MTMPLTESAARSPPSFALSNAKSSSMSTSGSATSTSTPSRRFPCSSCDKAFSTAGHLARHARVHTGERNHKCPFPGCETRCSRQDNLQQHYRIHLAPGSRRKVAKPTRNSASPASHPSSLYSGSPDSNRSRKRTRLSPSDPADDSPAITAVRTTRTSSSPDSSSSFRPPSPPNTPPPLVTAYAPNSMAQLAHLSDTAMVELGLISGHSDQAAMLAAGGYTPEMHTQPLANAYPNIPMPPTHGHLGQETPRPGGFPFRPASSGGKEGVELATPYGPPIIATTLGGGSAMASGMVRADDDTLGMGLGLSGLGSTSSTGSGTYHDGYSHSQSRTTSGYSSSVFPSASLYPSPSSSTHSYQAPHSPAPQQSHLPRSYSFPSNSRSPPLSYSSAPPYGSGSETQSSRYPYASTSPAQSPSHRAIAMPSHSSIVSHGSRTQSAYGYQNGYTASPLSTYTSLPEVDDYQPRHQHHQRSWSSGSGYPSGSYPTTTTTTSSSGFPTGSYLPSSNSIASTDPYAYRYTSPHHQSQPLDPIYHHPSQSHSHAHTHSRNPSG